MIRYSLVILFFVISIGTNAQSFCSHFKPTQRQRVKKMMVEDKRTDSFDVKHYHINLDIQDFLGQKISGYTDISIHSKVNGLQSVRLDLLKLSVNKISIGATTLNYTYNDTILLIDLGTARNANDTFTIRVEYKGKPQQDKSWGGFYFSGSYAFNMGVGFDANPHNFGRVWFPCVDDFKSRSTYDYTITTPNNYRAMCNGLLQSETSNPDNSITWHWKLSNTIPTYLSSVAVAPYKVFTDSYNGSSGSTPITLAGIDTNALKGSFINLKGAFAGFEKWYGVHRFERVGFNGVPFNAGAMEHATNIAYPNYAIDGTTGQETLMAHEFSHHWWGDNTTCRTAEDMWLNEGWASYSESLFLEEIYGKQRYKDNVMANHFEVLRWAHLRDGQPWPISGIPHAYTYGVHVYKKGADVLHTLRNYVGDSTFANTAKDFHESYKYNNVNSEDLKAMFKKHQNYSFNNMDDFFDSWVYGKGFPAISGYIVGVTQIGTGSNFNCSIRFHQQLRFTDKPFKGMLVNVSFLRSKTDFSPYGWNFIMTNTDTVVVMKVPFNPVAIFIDRDNDINDAVTENEIWLKNSNQYNFNWALMNVNTTSNTTTDSTLLRIEHHWTAPVPSNIPYPNLYASSNRYWRVLGPWSDTLLDVVATIVYDGSTPGGFTSGWLDNDIIKITEDSLVLLYRPDPRSDWTIYPYYQKTTGNVKDKRGNITLSGLKKGEYVFAMYDRTLGINNDIEENKQGRLNIYPNPADGLVKIEFDDVYRTSELKVMDNAGKIIQVIPLFSGQNFVEIDTLEWASGIYYVSLANGLTQKLIVE